MKFIVSISFLLLLLPWQAYAELPPGVSNDFSTISGYIIMPVGDEFLIDLDASSNLKEGDILTLIMQGEKVVHPVTKEVLGNLELPKGFLEVTRIKSGYSYAKLLFSETPPAKGDQVRRFEQVPSSFETQQGDNAQIEQELKNGLAQLNWLDNESSTQPLINFVVTNNTLSVKNASGVLLRSYRIIDNQISPPAQSIRQPAFGVTEKEQKPLEKAVNSIIDAIIPSRQDPPQQLGIISKQQQKQAGIWMGPRLEGTPVGIAVSDLDGDGYQETALAMSDRILIGQIYEDDYRQEAEVEIPLGTVLLSLDALDLDNSGLPELYLTAFLDGQITSMVVELRDGQYQRTIERVRWFLRATTLPGEGTVLLGQSQGDRSNPFRGNPFRVKREENSLTKGAELVLPDKVNLYGFVSLQKENNTDLFAYLSEGDYLHVITSDGDDLWESAEYYGGSETSFFNTENQASEEILDPVYIRARVRKNPEGGVLVIQNDGQRILKGFRMYKSSRLLSLSWNGHALMENWRTSRQNGYLADFTLADANNDGQKELVLAMKFKHKTLLKDAKSTIVTYQLK